MSHLYSLDYCQIGFFCLNILFDMEIIKFGSFDSNLNILPIKGSTWTEGTPKDKNGGEREGPNKEDQRGGCKWENIKIHRKG